MCLRDLLEKLRSSGVRVSESQVRWAVSSGKIHRPRLDGSLRFVFEEKHVKQLRDLFSSKEED